MMRLIGLAALLLGAFGSNVAHAQSGPLIMDGSRPDRAPATTEGPPPAAVVAGSVETDVEGFKPLVFRRVAVQGSSLPAETLRAGVAPFVGKTLSLADLEHVTAALAGVYSKSDVALYSILLPRQTFEGGVVRIRVVEGHISSVRVTAQAGRPAPELTEAYAGALTDRTPLSKAALERKLNLIRDIPGATSEIQLLQGDRPGAVVLDVKQSIRRIEAGVSVNSRGSAMLGKTQVGFEAHANSLLREGDRTSLSLVLPTDIERFQFVSLTERQPIGQDGTGLTVNVGYLRTRPKIAGVDFSGEARTAGVTVAHPWIRSNTRNVFLTVGIDGLNSDNALFGRQISREHTRALRVAAAYSKASAKATEQASVTVSRGLDVLGARVADPRISDKTFSKLNAALSKAVFNDRAALRLAASAQYTEDALPASEKFAVGGAQFGRAFPSAVISGDRGFAVSLEAALRRSPAAPTFAGSEVYVFADYGQVAQTSKRSLLRDDEVASIGAGIRVVSAKKGVVEIEAAQALNGVSWRNRKGGPRLTANFRSLF